MLRAVSLLAVLLVAKTIILLACGASLSWWAPVAYFWQDVFTALMFLFFDRVVRWPALAWAVYAVMVAYVAVNVPVALVLSTPLTWTIIRAAGGPLADSIAHYLTVTNLAAVSMVVVTGVGLPLLLRRRFGAMTRADRVGLSIGAAILIAAIGPYAASRLDTRGLHRNALGALLPAGLHTSASPTRASRSDLHGMDMSGADEWRRSPFGSHAGEDLSRFRGIAKGRNVLLVVLESTAARYLGLYGAPRDPMPRLSALAAQSIVVDHAYAAYPESVKGLFAVLCSRFPAFDTSPEIYARVPCASLACRLKEAGYRTALFHSGRFAYLGMRSVIDGRGFDTLEDAGAIGGRVESSFGVDERSTVKRLLGWIDTLEPRDRFFITYLPIAGHHPYVTTVRGPFADSDEFHRSAQNTRVRDPDFTQYLNALHESDQALSELLQGLAARHLDDRTLIVVMGDHGEAFGQHSGNFAHTLFIYDENERVPYLIVASGIFDSSIRTSAVVSIIDTAPTILDLLGLPVPHVYQGVSLLDATPRMALFYTDYSIGWLGLVDGCWKFLYEVDAKRSRLFDVCRDPDETIDRSADFVERVNEYRDRVEDWAAAQKEAILAGR